MTLVKSIKCIIKFQNWCFYCIQLEVNKYIKLDQMKANLIGRPLFYNSNSFDSQINKYILNSKVGHCKCLCKSLASWWMVGADKACILGKTNHNAYYQIWKTTKLVLRQCQEITKSSVQLWLSATQAKIRD